MKRLAETRHSLKMSNIFIDFSDLESNNECKDIPALNSLIKLDQYLANQKVIQVIRRNVNGLFMNYLILTLS